MKNSTKAGQQGSFHVLVVIIIVVVLCGALAVVGFNALHKNTQNNTNKTASVDTVTFKAPLGKVTTKLMNTTGFSSDTGSAFSIDLGAPTISKKITSNGSDYSAKYVWLKVPATVTLTKGEETSFAAPDFAELRDSAGHRLRAVVDTDASALFDDKGIKDGWLKVGQSLKVNLLFDISQPQASYTIAFTEPATGTEKGASKSFKIPFDGFGTPMKIAANDQSPLPSGTALGSVSGDLKSAVIGGAGTEHYTAVLGKPTVTKGRLDYYQLTAPKTRWVSIPYNVTLDSTSGDRGLLSVFQSNSVFEIRDAHGYRVSPVLAGDTDVTGPTSVGESGKGVIRFDADPRFGPFTIALIDSLTGKTVDVTRPFNIQ